jgi:hypothetical protein
MPNSLEEQNWSKKSESRTDMTAVEEELLEPKLPSVVNSVQPYHLLETEPGSMSNVLSHLWELKSD